MHVCVVGLGKLGLCTAACFASKGHKVIGVEQNPHYVQQLQNRQCPIDETGLEDLLAHCWDNLDVTHDLSRAVMESEIVLIIVPTPSLSDGRFTNEYVENVLKEMGPVLRSKSDFTVIDCVSTVMPGSSDQAFRPLLEELSGKTCGEDFGLVYNPEFIALGSVVRDFLNPDMVLIGASDERSARITRELYASTCDSDPRFACMSLVNAEITKLSLNCFVTMKISFANELSSLCELVPGADVDAITNAIGADTRVGSKYLKGGLGFGGPCFPRDNIAFQAFAEDLGTQARLGPQVVAINQAVVGRLFQAIENGIQDSNRVAILGMSYKAGTHIVEESQSVILAKQLTEAGYEVSVHDPRALPVVQAELNGSVACVKDMYECMENAGVVVLMTCWPVYETIDWMIASGKVCPGALVLDCWRTYKNWRVVGLRYAAIGMGSPEFVEASC